MKISLKACRVNVKASAREMADYIGVTEDTIYNWESGKYSPKAVQMPKIVNFFSSKGFNIKIDDINFLS